MHEYISKVKGQGRQYPHTADLDLGSGSGLRKSLGRGEEKRECQIHSKMKTKNVMFVDTEHILAVQGSTMGSSVSLQIQDDKNNHNRHPSK